MNISDQSVHYEYIGLEGEKSYQEFVHFFLIAVLRVLVKLLLGVLTRQKMFSQHYKTDCSFLQNDASLTRICWTSAGVALVWYMTISCAISFFHSIRFSLSYVSQFSTDHPKNCVRAWNEVQKTDVSVAAQDSWSQKDGEHLTHFSNLFILLVKRLPVFSIEESGNTHNLLFLVHNGKGQDIFDDETRLVHSFFLKSCKKKAN